MSDVNAKLDEAALYIERNPTLVKSITSFPYTASVEKRSLSWLTLRGVGLASKNVM